MACELPGSAHAERRHTFRTEAANRVVPITSVDVIVAGGDPVAGIENARVRRSIDEAMVLPFPCRSFARGAWITARVFRRRSRASGSFWRGLPQALSFGAATRPAVRALRVHT